MTRATRCVLAVAVGGLLLVCNVEVARGQCQASESLKLTASDGALGDLFGVSVSIHDDLVAVGAVYDNDNGSYSGSAYIYRRSGSGWIEEAKLLASDGTTDDTFGNSVSAYGEVVLVGAPFDDDACPDDPGCDSGSAYAYRYTGGEWIEEAKLVASDPAAYDYFAWSVSICGDLAVIGADSDDDNGQDSGSAYIFRFDGVDWVEETKLTASDGETGDRFGVAVALDGDSLVVGAPWDDDNGDFSGSAYIYRHIGGEWIEEAKLTASDAEDGEWFGLSVALSGDVAVIGAPFDSDMGVESGSAYLFRRKGSTWIEEAKIIGSDVGEMDHFGMSASLHGDVAVVGVPEDDSDGPRAGAAYAYRHIADGWIEDAKLTLSEATQDDFFGWSVSVDGGAVVIGAYGDDDNGTDSGSASVFLGLSDCNANGALDLCDITDGTSEDDNGDGVPDECEVLAGDMNCDGTVNTGDIPPFSLALVDPDAYVAAYLDCDISLADVNCDGTVDGLDIPLFVDCVLTGNCDHCPQPGTCCSAFGGCTETLEVDCAGDWLGEETACEPNPCETPDGMVSVPGGEFEMGDSFDEGGSDELPVHTVYLSRYYIDTYEVANQQYADGLNWAWAQGGLIEVNGGVVYKAGGTSYPYCDTYSYDDDSCIHWDGATFTVTPGREDHPMIEVSWYGSVAYCNWRSAMEGRPLCYDLETWTCDFDAVGYRLPTEAEWEKAAGWDPVQERHFRFGEHTDGCGPGCLDGNRANYSNSDDPFECGGYPWTTPVGFYNGDLHDEADFGWPCGFVTSYQTQNAQSYYGCYDMSGNVWEWCHDWWDPDYYDSSPYDNPQGPAAGTSRIQRGGHWLDGLHLSRSARRMYHWPDYRNFHSGFRCALGTP